MALQRPKLLIFDVNETLLDLEPLKMGINQALGSEYGFDLWFRTLLHYSLVETLTGNYEDFGKIAKAVLHMVSMKFEVELPDSKAGSILNLIKESPVHSEVPEALSRLKKSGYLLAALSNGNSNVVTKQLQFAEIDHLFDGVFSVESVRKYKPMSSPYLHVLSEMQVQADQTLMIAAHGWDILGAKRVGLKTAFIQRAGKYLYPINGSADLVGPNLLQLAEKLSRP